MATPKLFNKLKDITSNIESTTLIANAALPMAGGEVSGDLNVVGELNANLIGNASTATKLASAGKIMLAGGASGSVSFDGSDTTLTVSIVDDSHNHTIANVDNLETTLNAKANIASPTFTGTPKAPTATAGTNTTQIATTAFVTNAVANKTSITGNAGTATKLASAKTITLSGDVSGSVSFDGSDNVTITTTVADDSHNHTIANVDNLETTLNAKAPLASPALTGTPTAPTAAAGTNTTQIATTAFVQALVDSKIAASDAMIYKGTIGTGGTVTALPNTHSTGWTYKVITAGTYAGVKCNVGDMIVCLNDGTAANNAHWTVIEGNIDGAVTGPASSVDGQIAVFNGTTGKVIKDSGFTIAKSVPADAKFSDTTYSASDGVALSGTNFTNSGVRSISTGSANGTISVNTNGTAANVAVKGLGSAAYTESSAYAASSHTSVTSNGNTLGHVKLSDAVDSTSSVSGGLAATPKAVKTAYDLANAALPKNGGTITGDLTVEGTLTANIEGNADSATTAASCTGNAATATKLAAAGKIMLAGDASGTVSFDGSDATLTVTISDDSHNHTIANVDNLETVLNAKANIASPTFTGVPAAPTATAGTNTTQIATTAFVTSAVSTKANTADVVALTGNQTIAGTKTFSSTISGSVSGNAGTATKLATARTIDGVSFDGSGSILHYGTCSTDAATAAKTVTLANYTLNTGSRVMVKFTVTNTAANPTLNVNSTGAKNIMYRGSAIAAGYLSANRVYEFVYDGTDYELVGDINTDTNTKVTQTLTTTNAEYALLAMADAAATANKTNTARFASAVTLNPSSGTITATTFKGALSGNAATATTAAACTGNAATATKASSCTGNAATATKLAASKNIALTGDVTGSAGFDGSAAASIATTLATSGVTAGSYGPSANASPAHSGNFSVPYITVDAKGRVTSASTKTITLPASGNTDTKVTQTVSTTNNTYPILACATANATATTTTTAIFASAIKINPSAGSLTATAVYNAVWNDYAEFFPRGEETEAGDFIALDLNNIGEFYVKASKETSKSVGIHSDSFAHLIGGVDAPDGQDFVEYNLPKFIPVGLVGRVKAKIVGEIKKGDFVVISDIPGVGRKFDKEIDSCMDIIGMACESSTDMDIKRVKVKLGN